MPKSFQCVDCGGSCEKPILLRLQFTRCGLTQTRRQIRQAWLSAGHRCEDCLLRCVYSLVRREIDIGKLFGRAD